MAGKVDILEAANDELMDTKLAFEAVYNDEIERLVSEDTTLKATIRKFKEEGHEELVAMGLPKEDIQKHIDVAIKVHTDYTRFSILTQMFKKQNEENQIIIDANFVADSDNMCFINKAQHICDTIFSVIGIGKKADIYCDPSINSYIKLYRQYVADKSIDALGIYHTGRIYNVLTKSEINVYKVPSDLMKPTYIEIPEDKRMQEDKVYEPSEKPSSRKKSNKVIYEEQNKGPTIIKAPTHYNQAYMTCEGVIYQINLTGLRY